MSKALTTKQQALWDKLREFGCVICRAPAAIHHCFTGAGGRKDHDKVLPLCHYHHQGDQGIHTLSRRIWEEKYSTETELLEKVRKELGMP